MGIPGDYTVNVPTLPVEFSRFVLYK